MSAIVTRVGTLVKGFFSRFPKDGAGLTAREYSLIASLILIGALGHFTPVGVKLSAIFSLTRGHPDKAACRQRADPLQRLGRRIPVTSTI